MTTSQHIVVLVLGDLGRSPRMQFHALALANSGFNVTLLGFRGEALLHSVEDHPRVSIQYLAGAQVSWLPWALSAPFRLLVLTFGLFATLLFRVSRCEAILIQTPPALPTIPIAWAASRLRRARLIVDWHNLGFLRFGERVGEGTNLQGLYRKAESYWGRKGDVHLCVSSSMSDWLHDQFGISDCRVVYDRPLAEQLASESTISRSDLFERLGFLNKNDTQRETVLIVSSTSWSDDEDPEMLLRVGRMLDQRLAGEAANVDYFIIITGKGPNRAGFEKELSDTDLTHVHFKTDWLSTEVYRALLRSADLGVCLHTSASGIDLPMKLADMMGASLPVACFNYSDTLKERFRDGEHGFLFETEAELAEAIGRCLGIRREQQAGAEIKRAESWEDGWEREALPVFQSRC